MDVWSMLVEALVSPFSFDVLSESEARVAPRFNAVASSVFMSRIVELRQQDSQLEVNLTLKPDYDQHICWLSADQNTGFAIAPDHELVNVFSTIKGRGREALEFALAHYSNLHLNCFAGGREERFYQQYGFQIFKREPNWTQGQPDVIYMRHTVKLEAL